MVWSEWLVSLSLPDPKSWIMVCIAIVLFYLGIGRRFEPLLLVPIGAGMLLANLSPDLIAPSENGENPGFLYAIGKFGLHTEFFPLLMFLSLGALTDFSPIMQRPVLILLSVATELGIYLTFVAGLILVPFIINVEGLAHPLQLAGAMAIVGSADGPTTIYTSSRLLTGTASEYLLGPIAVTAFMYMALVPVIQPPIMRLLTTKKERSVVMTSSTTPISRQTRIGFPIITILIIALIVPQAVPMIGMLMIGNLLRECGVTERLSASAQLEIANIVTLLLGLAVGGIMTADAFLQPLSLVVFIIGLLAFSFATASGVLFGKMMYYLSGKTINPLIGAAGMSAVPMAARAVNKVGLEENPNNYLLMHAMGPNISGILASATTAGVFLTVIPMLIS